MKKFLLAFGVILALAFSVTAATTDFSNTHTTTVSTDGDCDKCGKKDCDGKCAKGEKSCTKSCTKGEKKACCSKDKKASCSHKEGDKKSACTHKEGDKKAGCTHGAKKSSCGHH